MVAGAVALAVAALPAVASAGFMSPTITGVSPNTVPTSGGTAIIITGTGFYNVGGASLTIGGQAVATWSIVNSTRIQATAPPRAAGAMDVRFTLPGSFPPGYGQLTGGLTYYVPAPSTPNAPAAAAGDTQAIITVAASPGGEPATSHLITASPGGATCTVGAATGWCTITGLQNGTAYAFTDTAINAGGSSSPSALSTPVTPVAGAAVPVAPAAPVPAAPVVVPSAGLPDIAGLRVSRGPGGAWLTTGLVPDGATSVVQSAISGGAASAAVLRRRTRTHARLAATCPIVTTGSTRRFTCRLVLGTGRWTLVTQGRSASGAVAQSLRVVTARRMARTAVTG